MPKTTVTIKRENGEYSTTIYGNVIETVFFHNDGTSEAVGRSIIRLSEYALRHVATHENENT